MALHQILVRLVADQTYDPRRASVVKAIEALSDVRWDAGTSVWLVWHPAPAAIIQQHLVANSSIYRDGRDLLVVAELEINALAHIGVPDAHLLESIANLKTMPSAPPLSPARAAVLNALMKPKKS